MSGVAQVDPETTVDLTAYPIATKASPSRAALVARCRRDLNERQYCVLPDFIQPPALERMVRDVDGLLDQAYRNESRRNCFLQRAADPSLPADHPRNLFFSASYRMIASDLFAEDSELKGLYLWPPMRDLIAEIVDEDVLYPNEDPYQPVNVLCYGPGDCSAWHFDSTNAFTVTLMLRAAENGGEFEIAPNTRSDTGSSSRSDDAVLRGVLAGRREAVVQVPRAPGALVIFRGCHSVHRVTPVEGHTPRLMAVFVYETEPGVTGDPEVNETVYGPRTTRP